MIRRIFLNIFKKVQIIFIKFFFLILTVSFISLHNIIASSFINISNTNITNNDSQQEVEKDNDNNINKDDDKNTEKSGKKRSIVYNHFNLDEQNNLFHYIHCR